MEHLRSRAALEPAGLSRCSSPAGKAGASHRPPPLRLPPRLWIACALALLVPETARAHGMEFLLARLDIAADRVSIELTADCEANLMIPDEAAARAAMRRLFLVRTRDATETGWQQLAPLRFERRDQLDPQAPLPPDPTWAGRPHQLLTAVWDWSPPAGAAFQLALPRGEPLDALLWRAGDDAAQPVKWRMLIAGEETEWLTLPVKKSADWSLLPWALGFLAAAAGAEFKRRKRQTACAHEAKSAPSS